MQHLKFFPTPITRLPYYSHQLDVNLYSKRDDLFMENGGGSKARMLQYIFADISPKRYDVIVTAGGPCSNFNRACALMCAQRGVKMHLVEYTDNFDEFEYSLNYYICKLSGIYTTRCTKTEVIGTINKTVENYTNSGKRVKVIYGGGKSLEGIYAYFDAVEEIAKEHVKIDHLFVACGTGTTLTGICAGMQKYYPEAIVHGISTARTYNSELPVLLDNMNILNKYLNANYTFSNLVFHEDYLCGGYSKFNEDLFLTIKECMSNEGMITDPTYSGKAFWGMVNILRSSEKYKGKNILFWNTGGLFNLLSNNC